MGTRRIGIVGGGIVGVALAHRITGMGDDVAVTVLEKEPALVRHQTGRNSGVVHAGLYYVPGSLKARLCRRGVELLREFCAGHGLAYVECGKVVVALDEGELDLVVGPLYADLPPRFDALPLTDTKQVPYRSTVNGVCHACGHDAHAAIAN